MRRHLLILTGITLLLNNNLNALFGFGTDVKGELLNMKNIAETEEEIGRNDAIVKRILEHQNEKKKNFAEQKGVLAKNKEEAQKIASAMQRIVNQIQTLEAQEKDLAKSQSDLKQLEDTIADREAVRKNLNLASSATTVAGYLGRAVVSIDFLNMLSKRMLNVGLDVNANLGQDLTQDFNRVQEEIKNLYEARVKIQEAITILAKSKPKLEALRKQFDTLSVKLDELKAVIKTSQDNYKRLVVLKQMVAPFSREAERITNNLNDLVKTVKCSKITGLQDLKQEILTSCKKASLDKVKSKLSTIDKCKKIDINSSSVDIEYCYFDYMKTK